MNTLEKKARVFRALSVEARLRIVTMLAARPLCVGAVAARAGITQGAVSQHLRVLRDAGIVRPERAGLRVHYSLCDSARALCMQALDGVFRENNPQPAAEQCPKGGAPCARRKVAAKRPRT